MKKELDHPLFGQSALENSFFLKEDQKLIENLRKMKMMEETKESLSKISGITNNTVLQKLVDLNIRPETLASLSLIPLIEVAWADGKIGEKEKKALLAAAQKPPHSEKDIDVQIFKSWLTHKPSPDLLEAWTHYIQELCQKLTAEEKKSLKSAFLGHAKEIAEASGGILGLGLKISKEEKEMLKKLEAAFK
jgi:hypothetical protein